MTTESALAGEVTGWIPENCQELPVLGTGRNAVLLAAGVQDLSTLSRAEFPEDMEEDFQFPAINIKAHTDLSYPGWSDFIQKFPEEDDDEAFESVQKELNIEEPEECSKLLGWADVIQDSMYEECDLVTKGYYLGNPEGYARITLDDRQAAETAMDRWQLLFQLDMVETDDFELMFGDCGRLYVFIKKEDLTARKFENAWGMVQCY